MIIINRTQEIKEKLEKDKQQSYFDKPEDLKAILAMNDEMEEVRREFKVKDRKSQISAANVVLTS